MKIQASVTFINDTKTKFKLTRLEDAGSAELEVSSSLVHAYTKVEYKDTFWFFDNSKGDI